MKEVIAWWEDGHGLWFVVQEEQEEGSSLVEEWSKIMRDPKVEDGGNGEASSPTDTEKSHCMSEESAQSAYGAVCELFVRVVKCLMVSAAGPLLVEPVVCHSTKMLRRCIRNTCP